MMKISKTCEICQKEYFVNRTVLIKKSRFCSANCRIKYLTINPVNYWLGKKRSPETVEKIASKKRGKPSWNKGIPMKSETKEKLSLAKKGKIMGSNHHSWKGGISRHSHSLKEPQYKEWRTSVFKRDNFICKIADINCKGQLEAHHILRWSKFPELRYEVNNGITLCHFHHPRKINDEMKLSPYFQELVTKM